ncbi:hypothetical protein [Vibrio variabilis]|uniref:hypothetical protein n=1 Tax=Vibrio variabilis TaxID=990271 RepID=UPI000DD62088|nr:hypothetical protein [Vibrio variabilis]
MRWSLAVLAMVMIQGCASQVGNVISGEAPTARTECVGSVELPNEFSGKFKQVDNPQMLAKAIGEPLSGGLCQGAVYQSTEEVTIYRAWNSTNPGSQFGNWWAFNQPAGKTADYRKDYEICYQWSPLDKLVKCTLQIGSTVVVGNGQSAKCSDYLEYPVSEAQQVFIESASDAVSDCSVFDSMMSWQPEQ